MLLSLCSYLESQSAQANVKFPDNIYFLTQGTAEIVVEELTLLERFSYQLREMFNRN